MIDRTPWLIEVLYDREEAMATKIDPSVDGIAASQTRFKAQDPTHPAAYDKLAKTLTTVRDDVNEWCDKIPELEARINRLPFLPTE